MRIVIQYYVFPLQRRGNTLGRETDAVIGLVLSVKQHMTQELFRHSQLSTKKWFSFVCSSNRKIFEV